jgi:hypothetical protein
MTNHSPDVKLFSRRIAGWIDAHPRTGWYVAAWAFLVSLNAAHGLVDMVLSALS